MWEYDELQFYETSTCTMPCGITITAPTLTEISKFGEERYLSMLSILTAEPFDLPYQLSKVGIDYTQIDSFTLFCHLVQSLTVDETRLLLGDFDFTQFKPIVKDGQAVLINRQKQMITKADREQLVNCIRKIHHLPKQQFSKVGNEFAKEMFIETARKDMERAKRKRQLMGRQSTYLPLMSSIIAHEGFSYTWDNIWNLHIHQFFDCVQRMQLRDNAKNLYHGLYSGTIEYSKIKKDLEWFKPLKG